MYDKIFTYSETKKRGVIIRARATIGINSAHGISNQVHIDGHDDGGLPEYQRGYPWFSWPKNSEELRILMQANDLFLTVKI